MRISCVLWCFVLAVIETAGCLLAVVLVPINSLIAVVFWGLGLAFAAQAVACTRIRERNAAATPRITGMLAVGGLVVLVAIAAVGFLAASVGGMVVLLLVIIACAPRPLRQATLSLLREAVGLPTRHREPAAVMRRTHRVIRRRGRDQWPGRTTGPFDTISTTSPAEEIIASRLALPAPEVCAGLSAQQLCWWWRASYLRLQAPMSIVERHPIIETRRALLDQLAQRDPSAFAEWLHSGARAASDPTRFFNAERS